MSNTTSNTNGTKGKFKPYRNRPGKRQALLELFSVLLILTSVPAFLGGVFSIFVGIAAFCLGIIGLFAWTRRHAKLFILLAILVIAASIVNIILRGTFNAQCVPFFQYSDQFNGDGSFNGQLGNTASQHGYDNSIWCGSDVVVYVTNALIILWAGLALFFALSALAPRNKTPAAAQTTEMSQTHTRTTVTDNY